jgi:hypothetical protein
MKIKLPNPNDFLHDEDSFWEQLELAIYHAKKSWIATKKKYPASDKNDYPWLSFVHEDHIEGLFEGKEKEENRDRQEISIEVNEL